MSAAECPAPADGLRARDLLNHHHDGWSQHGPCRLVRQTIDIAVDLSTLVVQYGTLCHRERRHYSDIVTRVRWIARQTYYGCGSGPQMLPIL